MVGSGVAVVPAARVSTRYSPVSSPWRALTTMMSAICPSRTKPARPVMRTVPASGVAAGRGRPRPPSSLSSATAASSEPAHNRGR